MKYKESWKVYNDNKNVLDFAIAKAKEQGIEQERKKNEQKQKEQALYFATILLQNSAMTDAEIAQATQLRVQEVATLRQNMW